MQTSDGLTFRRNRKHLNPTNENVENIFPFDSDIILAKTPHSEPQQILKKASLKDDPGNYVTRSGRVVKKKQAFYWSRMVELDIFIFIVDTIVIAFMNEHLFLCNIKPVTDIFLI